MILSLAAATALYATQVAAGWLVWNRVAGERELRPSTLARALLLGPAAVAAQMLAYGLVGIPFSIAAIAGPWWIAVLWELGRGAPAARLWPKDRWQAAAVLVGAAQVTVALVAGSSRPVYQSDAMNNFALTAKVFALHGGLAPDVLTGLSDPGNAYYPPLVAFNESLFFLVDDARAVYTLQPFFALGVAAWALLVVEACWQSRRPSLSLLCVVVVLATPEPIANAVNGLADVRVTATLLLVVLESRRLAERGGSGVARLAVAAVAAGLTKREGYVIAAGVCLFLLIRGRRLGASGRSIGLAVAAIAAAVSAWPAYAGLTGLPAQATADYGSATLLDAIANLPAVAAALADATLATDVDGLPRWGAIFFVAAAAGAWRVISTRDATAVCVLLLWATHGSVVAFAIAVLSAGFDAPVEWAIGSTVERLLLHQLAWLVLLLPTAAGRPAAVVRRAPAPA